MSECNELLASVLAKDGIVIMHISILTTPFLQVQQFPTFHVHRFYPWESVTFLRPGIPVPALHEVHQQSADIFIDTSLPCRATSQPLEYSSIFSNNH
jgi:hypothetical protein